jgi:hypothetical protein
MRAPLPKRRSQGVPRLIADTPCAFLGGDDLNAVGAAMACQPPPAGKRAFGRPLDVTK